MLLKLNDSTLFSVDTAIRFAEQYHVDKKMWNEVWKRHLAGYDIESLCGYMLFKTDKRISVRAMRRWLIRTEVYCRANHVMLMGVRVVHSDYFGVYEPFVIDEVLRGMRYSGALDSRSMV
jgi:hypothetical protein